jgi:STE24 endopeptidase
LGRKLNRIRCLPVLDMPILLILLLVAAVSPIEWPGPVVDLTVRETALLTLCLVLASASSSAIVSASTSRAVDRHPDRRAILARRYYRWRRFAFYLNVGITLVALFVIGWGHVVQQTVVVTFTGEPRLAPFAEVLVPGPYLLTLILNWAVYWPAERALHAAGQPERPFWSLFGFWLFQARQFIIVLPPVVLITVHQTVLRFYPTITNSWLYQGATTFAAVLLAVVLPWFIKPLLGLKRIPPGPVRTRLQATADRLGVRFSDLLLWPTQGAMANAMVIGIIPWIRYVIFTDRLLDGLDEDEVDAVLGHEVGHARFGHLPYYMLFFTLSASAIGILSWLVLSGLEEAGWNLEVAKPWSEFVLVLPLVTVGLYLFVVFGWLSRLCERQADLFGSRAVSCENQTCEGHTPETPLVKRGQGICPTGARTMARALERVMALNGSESSSRKLMGWRRLWQQYSEWTRAWQHGPLAFRVNYLFRVAESPKLAAAHDRWAFRIRLILVLVLLVILIGGGAIVYQDAWQQLTGQASGVPAQPLNAPTPADK